MDIGTLRRLPVVYEDGRIDLIEMDRVYYLEAQREKNAHSHKAQKTICVPEKIR